LLFFRHLKSITEPAAIDLQHLRRFAKPDEVPHHLHSTISGSGDVTTRPESGSASADLYLLVGPVTSINQLELEDILSKALPEPTAHKCGVHTIAVPLLAPTSTEQAKSWSSSYWPTVYKKSNPFGPHPSIVSRAGEEVIRDLDTWMGMAAQAALGSKLKGYGEAIGAVIVMRGPQTSQAVALAGDGRWKGYERDGIGNPMAHAVLRAIGMVAQKLKAVEKKECSEQREHSVYHEQEQDVFLDGPILPEEQAIYESRQTPSNGYLCHGLEIYITHEPCVACSMALLHSRFARVVFGQRMPRTGGLGSEICTFEQEGRQYSSLGRGLFWRKELNWSFLTWQTEVKDENLDIDSAVHI
jgi:tRNA-specific adenosine deaminase 3